MYRHQLDGLDPIGPNSLAAGGRLPGNQEFGRVANGPAQQLSRCSAPHQYQQGLRDALYPARSGRALPVRESMHKQTNGPGGKQGPGPQATTAQGDAEVTSRYVPVGFSNVSNNGMSAFHAELMHEMVGSSSSSVSTHPAQFKARATVASMPSYSAAQPARPSAQYGNVYQERLQALPQHPAANRVPNLPQAQLLQNRRPQSSGVGQFPFGLPPTAPSAASSVEARNNLQAASSEAHGTTAMHAIPGPVAHHTLGSGMPGPALYQRAVAPVAMFQPVQAIATQQHPRPPSSDPTTGAVAMLSPDISSSMGKHTVRAQVDMPSDGSGTSIRTIVSLGCEEELESRTPDNTSQNRQLMAMTMFVYRPTMFIDHTSPAALAQANRIMQTLSIPGGVRYMPVSAGSRLFVDGVGYGFTAFTIAMGSSYFQRLLAAMPHLEYAVRRGGPAFACYLEYLPPCSQQRWTAMHAQYGPLYGNGDQVTEESTLASILFTCVYLACKVVDRTPMQDTLRYMLTYLYKSIVSKAQAYDVESKCLEGLGFRLGPYFITDELSDD